MYTQVLMSINSCSGQTCTFLVKHAAPFFLNFVHASFVEQKFLLWSNMDAFGSTCSSQGSNQYLYKGRVRGRKCSYLKSWIINYNTRGNILSQTSIREAFKRKQARHGRISSGRMHFWGNRIIVVFLHNLSLID